MMIRYLVVLAYAALIIYIGIRGSQKQNHLTISAWRREIGPWMTAFSYGTAYFSAVLFIGFAGKIGWSFGVSGLWIALFNSLLGVRYSLGVSWLAHQKNVHRV